VGVAYSRNKHALSTRLGI